MISVEALLQMLAPKMRGCILSLTFIYVLSGRSLFVLVLAARLDGKGTSSWRYICPSPPSRSGDTFILSAKVWLNQPRFEKKGSLKGHSIGGSKNAFAAWMIRIDCLHPKNASGVLMAFRSCTAFMHPLLPNHGVLSSTEPPPPPPSTTRICLSRTNVV